MATNTERTIYIIELKDKFTRGMGRAAASADKLDKSMSKVRKNTDAANKSFINLSNIVKGASLAAAVGGIGRLASKAMTLTKEFQATRVAFGALVQDATKGNALFDWAKEFARANVVTFQQTTTSIRKLLAYGIGENQVRDVTRVLSEVSAAVGTDRLPYLTLALGQVYSAGRLYGTELRQFREHGVDIISELSKGLNMGTDKVRKQMEQGLITYNMVFDALKSMTEEGGRFNNFLKTAAETLKGSTGIMQSSLEILSEKIGSQFTATITNATLAITDFIVDLTETIDFDTLGNIVYRFEGLGDRLADVSASAVETTKSMGRLATAWAVLGTKLYDSMAGENGWLTKLGEYAADMLLRRTLGPVAGFALGDDRLARLIEWVNEQLPTTVTKLPTGPGDIDYPQPPQTDLPDWLLTRDQLEAKTREEDDKKAKTNRRVGTGSRDVIINIGNLIENVINNNAHYDKNVDAMTEQLRRALLTVVNDVTLRNE